MPIEYDPIVEQKFTDLVKSELEKFNAGVPILVSKITNKTLRKKLGFNFCVDQSVYKNEYDHNEFAIVIYGIKKQKNEK